jgi:glyoxylase-like metal-dependent hydrolase (beta-lactamase superfamily II)
VAVLPDNPAVHAHAIRQTPGLILIDTGVVGHERAYLQALHAIGGDDSGPARLEEVFLTRGHDDHTGSAAALAQLTGARVRGPVVDADGIKGRYARRVLRRRMTRQSARSSPSAVDAVPSASSAQRMP